MEGASAGGGREVELVCKTLQVEHKLFYFDLKENPRGRYLKISEKTASNRSTIIVPAVGISWFLDLFNYYVGSGEEEIFSKELQLDTKVFYFDVGDNRRGRFLKISEASASRTRSTIIVPAGGADADGWAQFRDILVQINEDAPQTYPRQNLQNSEPSTHLPRLSDDVGAGFISGSSAQSVPERPAAHPQDMMGLESSKVLHADQKRFFFDLGSNSRGHFLKISEVAGGDRSSIILPLSGLRQFHEAVGHFLDITRNALEEEPQFHQ